MKAISLLSGGLDSTVSLAYALHEGYDVVPLSIMYGQRHSKELEAAKRVISFYRLKRHTIVNLDLHSSFKTSALTSKDVRVPERRSVEDIDDDIPVTYVPARNLIFLSIAAGLGESEGADRIFIGANSLDYSGYPDCRPEFYEAFEEALENGTKTGVEGRPMKVEYPLIDLTKAEIVKLGMKLGAPLHLTWSCYKGGMKACGVCDSCLLRRKGFKEAGFVDLVHYEKNR